MGEVGSGCRQLTNKRATKTMTRLPATVLFLLAVGVCLAPPQTDVARSPIHSVDMQIDIVEFAFSDLEPLYAEGYVTRDALTRLRKQGKGKVLGSPRFNAVVGKTTTLTVTEPCIYEVDVDGKRDAGGGRKQRWVTEHLGVKVSVMPKPTSRNTVRVDVRAEHVELAQSRAFLVSRLVEDGITTVAEKRKPFFRRDTVDTTVEMRRNTTMLLGGAGNATRTRMTYVFLTVHDLSREKETQ